MNDDQRMIRALRHADRDPGSEFTDSLLDRLDEEISRDRRQLRRPFRWYAAAALAGTVCLYLFSGTALFQHWTGGGGRPAYLIVAWSVLLGTGMLALRGAQSKQTL